jgi:hypothetical protein
MPRVHDHLERCRDCRQEAQVLIVALGVATLRP